ncbi:MAG: UDP-3-O-(3-hydroxymyristoyl)glucosamine N-acyltransferase [Pseudomonadales bacterium]|nr:UDP-3-O-(3-hydroxymyristoyl)glucosamine N-acyltransferase [Pseudomonadales bacterium]
MDEILTLGEIAARVGGHVHGDDAMILHGLGSLGAAESGQISHLSSPTYKDQLATTKASAVILKEEHLPECRGAALVVDNPYLTFARVSQFFRIDDAIAGTIDASASIDSSAIIDATASIGANVVIGKNVAVAEGVQIFANTVVGNDCFIGRQTVLRSNVTLYSNVRIGERCVIHSGVVLGADGFGFTPTEEGKWQAIAQVGGLAIGSDVSIGANTCIDRGAIDDTVVEDGVQIDNLVQIGHNCRIGAHTLICGVVGLAGSTTVGKHCVFAGRSGAGGDQPVTICDGVVVSSCAVISQSVDKPGVYSGSMLFHEHSKWRRNALRFASLDELFKRVRKLERDKD